MPVPQMALRGCPGCGTEGRRTGGRHDKYQDQVRQATGGQKEFHSHRIKMVGVGTPNKEAVNPNRGGSSPPITCSLDWETWFCVWVFLRGLLDGRGPARTSGNETG